VPNGTYLCVHFCLYYCALCVPGLFPGGKVARGMALTTHPHLALRLKSRAICLLLLWAFMACSRMNFTFTFTFISELSGTASYNIMNKI
jgi:hypothetical protein